MQLITLTDLSFLANPAQLTVPIELKQEEFQLIMKQTFLKLPTEPLLLADPKVDKWIMEVSLLFPEVFEWEPPTFLVDTQFSAKLNKDVCVQINANAAFLGGGDLETIVAAAQNAIAAVAIRIDPNF